MDSQQATCGLPLLTFENKQQGFHCSWHQPEQSRVVSTASKMLIISSSLGDKFLATSQSWNRTALPFLFKLFMQIISVMLYPALAMEASVSPQGHKPQQNANQVPRVILQAWVISQLFVEALQSPLKMVPGSNSDAIPMPTNPKKKNITRIWNKQIINPFCLLIPQMPMTDPKISTKSKASRTPNIVYWLNDRAALVNAQIVTPSIASPTTKIKKAPKPVNPFIILSI